LSYEKQTWADTAVGGTPISASRLNYMETGIETANVDRVSDTENRPSAVTAGAGASWYDTDLSLPIWSDGTVWHDAAGEEV